MIPEVRERWLPMPTEAEMRAARESMWGPIENQGSILNERCGWKSCQFVREGRVCLTGGQWANVCGNRALPGEKYCREHMPSTPSRVVWFVIGAMVTWLFLRFIH